MDNCSLADSQQQQQQQPLKSNAKPIHRSSVISV